MSELLQELRLLKTEIEQLKKDRDFWTKEIRDLEELLIKKFPGPYLEFEVHLAEHCNLNCQGCDHFAPLAQPALADYEVFCADFARMAELFGTDVKSINLLGGEPLLNPEVSRFAKAARMYFPNASCTEIRLVTNGILLPKMDKSFWQICAAEKICIAITKYPIQLDYDNIFAIGAVHGVHVRFYDPAPGEKTLYRVPLKLSGDLDARRSYYKCTSANCCCFLKNGKLYPCTLIPNICHFNSYFNKQLPVTEEDYLDIYGAKCKEDIFTWLSRPRRFCRFCASETRVYDLEWRTSKRRIEEWLAEEQ